MQVAKQQLPRFLCRNPSRHGSFLEISIFLGHIRSSANPTVSSNTSHWLVASGVCQFFPELVIVGYLPNFSRSDSPLKPFFQIDQTGSCNTASLGLELLDSLGIRVWWGYSHNLKHWLLVSTELWSSIAIILSQDSLDARKWFYRAPHDAHEQLWVVIFKSISQMI